MLGHDRTLSRSHYPTIMHIGRRRRVTKRQILGYYSWCVINSQTLTLPCIRHCLLGLWEEIRHSSYANRPIGCRERCISRSMVKNDEIDQNANKSLTKIFWNAIFEQLWKWSNWPPSCPPNDAPTCESPRKTLTNGMESWGMVWRGPHEGSLAQSQKCDFQKMRITRHTEHLQTKSAHVQESSRCALSNGITCYDVGATITELTFVKKSNSI